MSDKYNFFDLFSEEVLEEQKQKLNERLADTETILVETKPISIQDLDPATLKDKSAEEFAEMIAHTTEFQEALAEEMVSCKPMETEINVDKITWVKPTKTTKKTKTPDTEEPSKDALELARENYKEYSLYVGSGRAYPCLLDGAKSSYKRAIYGMWKDSPRSIVKVAELAAAALPYHPHPTSISGVIVQLGENGNKFKFMKTQGNWGDSSKGIIPSADRYIGGMLSDLSLQLLCDSMQYCNYITGEIDKPEPEALPTLLPMCFINGAEGIPSGLPRLNIPCLDIGDMFDYYIDILGHKDLSYVPTKLPIPNIGVGILSTKTEWEDILKTGRGSLRFAPKMDISTTGVITITALPPGKTVEHVRKIVDKEILLDKIDFRDETAAATKIVIERVFKKQCDMEELYKRIFNKLQSSETYNLAFFDQDYIYVPCSFDKVVKANLQYLIDTHHNRLTVQIKENKAKLEVLQIIEKLKKTNNWKSIFDLAYEAAVEWLVKTFKCVEEVAQNVFKKPISYLTRAHDQEITDLINLINELENDKSDIYEMLLRKYRELKPKVLKEVAKNETVFTKAKITQTKAKAVKKLKAKKEKKKNEGKRVRREVRGA